jgi:hypothetical protein
MHPQKKLAASAMAMALQPLKNILSKKKNYENSKISPCRKYNLQKIL